MVESLKQTEQIQQVKRLENLFRTLQQKEIFCWGSGKHFRNSTYPFLCQSGLIQNLRGFVDGTPEGKVTVGQKEYPRYHKGQLPALLGDDTVIIIAVVGYEEIFRQLEMWKELSGVLAIPSIYLEALYEDSLLLKAKRPPLHFRKNKTPVIPRVIHTFWFSGEPLPLQYKKCLASWKKYAGDFEIKIWDLHSYQGRDCLFFQQAISDKNWAFASDYARADVLYRYGGVYMDLDVEMRRPIDELLYNDAYMSFESLGRIECGSGMGALAGHKILEEICKSYENRPYFKEDGSWDNSTCPVRYTQVIEKYGLKKNGGFQMVEDVTVYPFEMLTAKSFDTGVVYETDLTYTIHHHSGNWVPASAKDALAKRYAQIQDFFRDGSFVFFFLNITTAFLWSLCG